MNATNNASLIIYLDFTITDNVCTKELRQKPFKEIVQFPCVKQGLLRATPLLTTIMFHLMLNSKRTTLTNSTNENTSNKKTNNNNTKRMKGKAFLRG